MNRTTVLIICCALLVLPSFAQNLQNHNSCSPVGTWYGGSDLKYVLVITPIAGNRFAIRGDAVFFQPAFGYQVWSPWSGELEKLRNGQYIAQEIAMYTTSTQVPPPPDSFQLGAVHGRMEFIDCNTLQFKSDFFGFYFGLNKIPFFDPLDLNLLPPGGLTETYLRMPRKCPACNAGS